MIVGRVSHGPIADRQQMLIGDFGEREQPGSKSAGQNDASHLLYTPLIQREGFIWFIWLIWFLWLVSFNQTNKTNQINQTNKRNQLVTLTQ
jgi:hypothetical protein